MTSRWRSELCCWTACVASLVAAAVATTSWAAVQDEAPPRTQTPDIADTADAATSEPAADAALAEQTADGVPRAELGAALTWISDLTSGLAAANKERRPALVLCGARWCAYCKKLDETLADARVRAELAKWTLIRIDIDDSPAEAKRLRVVGVPAMRQLSPTGDERAALDGFVPPERLLVWLAGNDRAETSARDDLLSGASTLDDTEIEQLIELSADRDPVTREAALRRMLPHRASAAEFVVEALFADRLATRLAAYELLREWSAPLSGIDPWRIETLATVPQQALRRWAVDLAAEHHHAAEELTAEQLAAVRDELDLLATIREEDMTALFERLVRYGPLLAKEIDARLALPIDERASERLQALGYRLFASDKLALAWPSGFLRLASADAALRHAALKELTEQCGPDDHKLLVRLFEHGDPLVRETALSTLHAVGGEMANDSLGRLLDDPDHNVRAAVLKQLAQSPSSRSVLHVIEKLQGEEDADLVVHGVRVLSAAGGRRAAVALIALLEHEAWQVRAEAAEALGKCLGNTTFSGGRVDDETRAEGYASLIVCLEDADGFVVARAMHALQSGELLAIAVEPLVAAAMKHPDLADEAIELLASGQQTRRPAVPHLQGFLVHEDPVVRGAALRALVTIEPEEVGPQLLAALSDMDSRVRSIAAHGIFDVVSAERSPRVRSADSYEDLLAAALDVADRHDWESGAAEPLEQMLAAASPDERLEASVTLCLLNRVTEALPHLVELATPEPARLASLARALRWLPSEARQQVVDAIIARKLTEDQFRWVAEALAANEDPRSLESLWRLAADLDYDERRAASLLSAIRRSYGISFSAALDGADPSSFEGNETPQAAASNRVAAGSQLQRVVALQLLAQFSREETLTTATAWLADAEMPFGMRKEAMRAYLMVAKEKDAAAVAIDALDESDVAWRKLALAFLALGKTEMVKVVPNQLLEESAWIAQMERQTPLSAPTLADPPHGLTAEPLRALLAEEDADNAALAGYLLTLLEDPAGLPPLLARWRNQPEDPWRKLVYRAIASLDDDEQTPLLEAIYKSFDENDTLSVRDFYWTIRTMSGAAVRKLRDKVRAEVGMDQLR